MPPHTNPEHPNSDDSSEAPRATNRLLRALRLGQNKNAVDAAKKVQDLGNKSSSGAQEGIEGIKRFANAVVETSGSVTSQARKGVSQRGQAFGEKSRSIRNAVGAITQNVKDNQDAQAAARTLREQGVPLAVDTFTAITEAGGLPVGRLGKVGKAVVHHAPKVVRAAELLGVMRPPVEGSSGKFGEIAITGAELLLPPPVAAVIAGNRVRKRAPGVIDALGTIAHIIVKEVREYGQNPQIAEAIETFGEEPPPPPPFTSRP